MKSDTFNLIHGLAGGWRRHALYCMTIKTLLSKFLFPTLIAVVISYFLLTEISRPDTPTSEKYSAFQLIKKGVEEIVTTLGKISFWAVTIGFFLYSSLVWTKALRFRELLELNVPVTQLTPILALHTFWGNLLPMRSGDLSYIYLMKRREGVDETKSVASLMLASIIDLMSLLAFMVGTGWLLRSSLVGELSYTILFAAPLLIFCALAVLLSTACIAPKACVSIASYCAQPLLNFEKRPITWLVTKCLDVVHELTHIRFDWRFSKIWGYSLLGLGIRFGFQCYLAREMGIHISVISLIFALAFTSIFNLLPVQSIGNFGTVEFPFVAVLTLLGTEEKPAIVAGFSLHLIILLYCIPLGVYGLIKKTRHRNQEMKK
ncbi:MAG: lysylphosphatidylglycerol synthase transmembrane domain-containing protein [Candidatus Poribacteria bacterium]|nr:lysylphosphatidylglycerol synthase transmembrane domain-containing protein [Candidatus Poribacteria bacterium]MDE0506555.1 lysylphosphatidylglycerol synthase transmembrane domain-containing protein [Candidatus Poribacteria bacterium]